MSSARGDYIAKAMVTKRIKPMMIDGKKTYQIGIPIHWGYRGIAEDEGQDRAGPRQPAFADRYRSKRLHAGVQRLPGEDREGYREDAMANGRLQIKQSRATSGPFPAAALQRELRGLQADRRDHLHRLQGMRGRLPRMERISVSRDDLRQHISDDAVNGMELLQPDPVQRASARRRHAEWLMRKDQCMHCADPGCLRACPADGAIVQYSNGIVDFNQENCIGCQYCVSGCPFNIPKFNPRTKKVYKCTLCSDRVGAGLEPACIKACPTGCLQFGSKDDMKELAESARRSTARADFRIRTRACTTAGVGGTHVIYVLHDATNPEAYGGLPADPHVPWLVRIWKGPLKWVGGMAMTAGIFGVALHYLRFGPKIVDREEGDRGVNQEKSVNE